MHRRGHVRASAAIPAVGLIAGSACGLLAPLPPHLATTLLVLAGGLALWAWRAGAGQALVCAAAVAFFAGGARQSADAWEQAWRPPIRLAFETLAREERLAAAVDGRSLPSDDEASAVVEGRLLADAAPGPNGVSLTIDVETLESGGRTSPAPGGLLATVGGTLAAVRAADWRAGRRVRAAMQLRRIARYLDADVPDAERALARKGVALVGFVKSGALVDVLARGDRLQETLAAIRAFARRAVAESVGRRSPRAAAIVVAIIIGDRAGLDPDVERRLQEAGTYHVIAISGGNIAILAGLLLATFRVAGVLGRGAMLTAIAALVGYAALVGGGASVDRATLMAVVYFAARAADQRSAPLNTLALVAACLVFTGPLSAADPAFVLTFGATLALLLAMPAVPSGRLAAALGVFAASAAAELMLFPVSALVFERVTFAGLALNFAAVPLMAVAQVAGMALVPAALVSRPLADALGIVAWIGAEGLVRSADLVRFAPGLAYRVAPPPAAAVILYYGSGALAYWLWRRGPGQKGESAARLRRRAATLAAGAVALGAAVWILADPRAALVARGDGRLHVTFIDVGQGDAAFLRLPDGATMLVDAGGLSEGARFDVGDRVVAPVLRSAGVARLDTLVVTHGDPDHAGGADAIVREFRPREVWEGVPVPRLPVLQTVRADASAVGARWTAVRAGERRRVGEVEVRVCHPPPPDWERQKVRNDDSVVLDVRWRDVSILLTGDIGLPVERQLAGGLPPAPLRVVKVPHHGSLTSSTPEFVRSLAPRVAVFSVGRGNHFGHPAPEVVQRYEDAGAAVFRTDEDGAITLDSDGESLDIRTYTGRRLRISLAERDSVSRSPRSREGRFAGLPAEPAAIRSDERRAQTTAERSGRVHPSFVGPDPPLRGGLRGVHERTIR
ncbi:MAG: ComEC/Rec2 family competence protein [Betaproteobacteria bacterium]